MNKDTNKEGQEGCDVICRNHSARSERDLYRVCPSKLSKRELENLYFALLENNSDLKRTAQAQQDKIKVLSTKVQRLTAVQRNSAGKEKDCCSSKVIANQQKETILELNKANERMADRIRILNMRLCSAKQFLKRSPSQTAKCKGANAPVSFKDAGAPKSTQTVETETVEPEKDGTETQCQENKCRTLMDELKQKIVNLQEELSITHGEYSIRISKLESDVSSLRDENVRVRSSNVASEHALQLTDERADGLRARLRAAEGTIGELTMKLAIERRKVTELETALKLANTSSQVVKIIERLNVLNQQKQQAATERYNSTHDANIGTAASPTVPPSTPKSTDGSKFFKSDDSGCADLNKSSEAEDDNAMKRVNQEMLQKMYELQTQLDGMRVKAAGESAKVIKQPSIDNYEVEDIASRDARDLEWQNDVVTTHTEINENATLEVQQLGAKKASLAEKDIDTFAAAKESHDEGVTPPQEADVAAQTGVGKKSDKENENNMTGVKPENNVSNKRLSQGEIKHNVPREDANDAKYQIPGPIPVLYPKDMKTFYKRKSCSKETGKKKVSEDKCVKIIENDKWNYIYDNCRNYSLDNTAAKEEINVNGNGEKGCERPGVAINEAGTKEFDTGIKTSPERTKVSPTNDTRSDARLMNDQKANLDIFKNPSEIKGIEETRNVMVNKKVTDNVEVKESVKLKDEPELSEVKKPSNTSYCPSDTKIGAQGKSDNGKDKFINANVDDYELCAARAAVCRCRAAPRREVSVFRSCSGTLRFHTVDAPGRLRHCDCDKRDEGVAAAPPPQAAARRDSATYTRRGTYTVPARASPDNTDREISSLSDLPPEKDGASPREPPLSPGEQRASTTATNTDTGRTADYGSLSEGELPEMTKENRPRKLSLGENLTYAPPCDSTSQIEATLQAIGAELARCRQMLDSSRGSEATCRLTQTEEPTAPELEHTHKLRRAAANRRLSDTHSHTAVFTLHIGTLVLSDEALLNSQDKSSILMWKFYDQSMAMTRIGPGRVVRFDLSTEYDVAISEEFLKYMREEYMPLVVCDVNKQDQPFGSCWLPLRDALQHSNKRTDMSLALAARHGGQLGVLDLWCALRTDPGLLHPINCAFSSARNVIQPSKDDVLTRSASRIEADHSETRMSQDIAFVGHRGDNTRACNTDLQQWERSTEQYDPDWGEPPARSSGQRSGTPPKLSTDVDGSQGPPSLYHYGRVSVQSQKLYPDSQDLGHNKAQVGFENNWPEHAQRNSSELVVSEVAANITSPDERKKALERNVQAGTITRFPNMDDDISQEQASFTSLKNMDVKHRLKNITASKITAGRRGRESLHDRLRKERKLSLPFAERRSVSLKPSIPLNITSKEDVSYLNIPKKNSMLSKIFGISRHVDGSKKTVKYNDAEPSQAYSEKPIQQESSEDIQGQSIDITILWLALNEECEAMVNPNIQRLYVAYSFMGRRGADLETPISLPKPNHYADKCYFNFKKTFHLHDADLPLLGHLSRCRAGRGADPRDCVVFSVVSEPPEDPLGLACCEDIGYAHLYLGDILAYSAGGAGYTEVVPVRAAQRAAVCGVLAVRLDGLHVLRRCLTLAAAPDRLRRQV